MFDCYLKRVIYNKRFEMTYVALSQVNNNNNKQMCVYYQLTVHCL